MTSRNEIDPDTTHRNDDQHDTTKGLMSEKLVYLVTKDPDEAKTLAQQISHFGYQVQIVQDFTALKNAVAKHMALSILLDISSPKNGVAENDVFDQIPQWQEKKIPFMFISDVDKQEIRLKAIKVGGIAFFPKPVDLVNLIDKLDETRASETDDHRVLIVEDQSTVANYYQIVLKMAGMTTKVVTDSKQVLTELEEFHPDLILMDLYLPDSDGIQLAKMIRQIDEYVSVPIVFLSSEGDFNKQMEAMSLGGDEFLEKPIKADHLVSVVRSRLERLRIIRALMIRDSLTALLNHTSFRGQLKQELERCRRQETKLALAMLDLDEFKRINDTYGHSVGDSVLKSLSRLLRQRLRKSDIIGRYGGEEFVVILLDVDEEHAYQVMNEIREHFAEVQHFAPGKGFFSVTFSCGIATYPEFSSSTLISDAADQAMYRAKEAGRNKVMTASS
jgi:diguanylate cyclase (GGDEF)-like protein